MAQRVVVHGAAGRMGQRLVAMLAEVEDQVLAGAVERAGHPRLGEDAGLVAGLRSLGVTLTAELPEPFDVVIDFSTPEGAERMIQACRQRGRALVLATTGLDAAQQAELRQAARDIAIVWAPNMSPAVNLAMKLTETAARALARHASGVDVEIVERHHRFKEDAPSGTALAFGELIAGQMGQSQQRHGRSGRPGPRGRDEVGYHAIRAGDHPGEHTILFGMLGESLEIRVAASGRDSYASGALAAARFLQDQPPGCYSMLQVLGLA